MKKSFIYSMAALLVAGAAFTACSSSENDIENGQPEAKKYTLTVEADKGGYVTPAGTRALFVEGDKSLDVQWEPSKDVVGVYSGDGYDYNYGYNLYPQDLGQSTILSGTVSWFDHGTPLILKYNPNADYEDQDGTFANLDLYYKANAEVNVINYNSQTNNLGTSKARFVAQQAIVKFTLNQNVTSFKVFVKEGDSTIATYTVGSIAKTKVIWMAIDGFKDKTVVVEGNGGSPSKTVPHITMNNGEFWDIQVNF